MNDLLAQAMRTFSKRPYCQEYFTIGLRKWLRTHGYPPQYQSKQNNLVIALFLASSTATRCLS